jgi:hypothetical protein
VFSFLVVPVGFIVVGQDVRTNAVAAVATPAACRHSRSAVVHKINKNKELR